MILWITFHSVNKEKYFKLNLIISPSGDYTRRSYTYNGIAYHGGAFNIVERLPACVVKPDLGPKLYIAYSKWLCSVFC
jgi:hypothetical protein